MSSDRDETTPGIVVDQRGLSLPGEVETAFDVYFDDQHVWSFAPAERRVDRDGRRRVGWPRAMNAWLDGESTVSLRHAGEVAHRQDVRFGAGRERIRFVDRNDIPVMIDKWGLVQRPFAGRGDEVVEQMLDVTEQIIAVLREECGVACWLAFGSLLGAVREGRVIAHDSDVDLAYLTEQTSPHAMNLELYEMARALRRRGLRVMNKTGSFLTVLFTAPDGAQGSVDVYTCFYLGGRLHETATVRAEVPREAVLPLGVLAFEGRELPVPADPDTLLAASYGPDWRTPDPSFRHQPGPEVTERFQDWFGSLMLNRRDWERGLRNLPDSALQQPSSYAVELGERLDPGTWVLDVGAGAGADVIHLARTGLGATGIDYARGAFSRAVRLRAAEEWEAHFNNVNLYDLRDTLTMAALLARRAPGPRVVYARRLLEALAPRGRAHFYSLAGMLLRPGERICLETRGGEPGRQDPLRGGRRYRVDLADVVAELMALGFRVDRAEPVEEGRHRIEAVR